MKFFKEEEKKAILNEFNERKGIYTRLYDVSEKCKNGFGNPIGIAYRCISKVNPEYVVVVRFMFDDEPIDKDHFDNMKYIGMNKVIKMGDRFLNKMIKQNIKLDDFIKVDILHSNFYQETDNFVKHFINKTEKYYKRHMKVIAFYD